LQASAKYSALALLSARPPFWKPDLNALPIHMPRVGPHIVIISTVSVIVQLALTILAWGDWSSFFARPARTWLVIGSFLLLILAWFSDTSGLSGIRLF
jgi:hypothetical protein